MYTKSRAGLELLHVKKYTKTVAGDRARRAFCIHQSSGSALATVPAAKSLYTKGEEKWKGYFRILSPLVQESQRESVLLWSRSC